MDEELAAGMFTNMVIVLHHHEKMNLESAAEATRELVEARVADLRAVVGRVRDDRTRRCARAVCDWAAGSNHWHATRTARYQQQ